MCDPISGSMAALSVLQTQQQQAAADAQADAVNDAFRENNRMQNEAYSNDMKAYWDEEVAIQEEMFDNAEDAAEAKLDMQISQRQDEASMIAANAESTGGGQTPQALLGNLRRSQLNTARDLDEEYQRGVRALEGETANLQRDKHVRYNQAIGAINSAPRASYQSQGSKLMALGMAGASAYVQGQGMQGKPLFGETKGTTGLLGRKSGLSGAEQSATSGMGANPRTNMYSSYSRSTPSMGQSAMRGKGLRQSHAFKVQSPTHGPDWAFNWSNNPWSKRVGGSSWARMNRTA